MIARLVPVLTAGLLLIAGCGSPVAAVVVDVGGPAEDRRLRRRLVEEDLHRNRRSVRQGQPPRRLRGVLVRGILGSGDPADPGAHADVFASADTKNMDKAGQAGLLAGAPVNFATNTLTIAVAPRKPQGHHVISRPDQARPQRRGVRAAGAVWIGHEGGGDHIRSAVDPVSEESSVTDVLNKVTSGQADAGLVYVTDTAAAGDKVVAVSFPPEAAGAVNTYPIATLAHAGNPALAGKFVDLVTGPTGQEILTKAGFGKP